LTSTPLSVRNWTSSCVWKLFASVVVNACSPCASVYVPVIELSEIVTDVTFFSVTNWRYWV
jgi:hypothetical protein